MHTRIRVLVIVGLVLLAWIPTERNGGRAAAARGSTSTPEALSLNEEVRTYVSENGRRISISSRGNVVRFESPVNYEHLTAKRPLQGYLIAYSFLKGFQRVRRIAYDLYSVRSSNVERTKPDFELVSFQAPKDNTLFRFGQDVVAASTLRTVDGYLLVTQTTRWTAGTGKFIQTTGIKLNSSVIVRLEAVKHFFDYDPDNVGFDSAELLGKGETPQGSRFGSVGIFRGCPCFPPPDCPTCECPVCPPFDEKETSHGLIASGSKNPAAFIRPAEDLSGLNSASCDASLPGPVRGFDVMGGLCWGGPRNLSGKFFELFTATHQGG